MIRKLMTAAAVCSVLSITPAMAATVCKDAHGKAIRCTGHGAIKVVKDKKGVCKIAAGSKKGAVTPCPK
ncbi:hypothetical protein MTR62_03570 [Novosphingobium sp. 1949]|uniref:DUF2282 domain-containing protein n=1 Tax=Novosphingobium organovorum TaxID=2930092 RepID=A0ABT0B9R6_9SPHN|nr:hypothetical protein [Novosphingobium organovorum]MCJ2181787.1 hypothetical protein [Novosphingobium organovorum]